MVDGFFRGGLVEAEREAALRRQRDRQIGIQQDGPESQDDMGMQAAQQAEADARLFAEQLLAARRSNDQEIFERAESTIAPMLTRQLAVTIAGRKGIPFDQAMGEAGQLSQAIVTGIRSMSAPAAVETLGGSKLDDRATAAAPGQASASLMQIPAKRVEASATKGAQLDRTNARAADTARAEALSNSTRQEDLAGKEQRDQRGAIGAQAEKDVETIVGMLAMARQANDEEGYRRAEAAMAPVLIRSIATAIAARDGMPFEQAAGAAQQTTQALLASMRGLPSVAIAIPPTEQAPGNESGRVVPAEPAAPAPESDQSDEEARPQQPSKNPDRSLEDALRRLGGPEYVYKELEKLRGRAPELEESRRRWFEEYLKERGPEPEPNFWDKHIAPYLNRLMLDPRYKDDRPPPFLSPNQEPYSGPLSEEERRRLNNPDREKMLQELRDTVREREEHRGRYPGDDMRLPKREPGLLEEFFQLLPYIGPPVKTDQPARPSLQHEKPRG